MPDQPAPIARIRLSRSLPRLLALPALGLLGGAATIAGALLLVPGIGGLAVAAFGAVVVALATVGVLRPLSVRLEIEESAVRVSWFGGDRIYVLSPGPVTRVRLRGENASSLRGGRRLFGGQLGAARLRDEEDVEVVRLAPTPTAILVPTDRGRLAIAAADEELLLDALSRAARARQRLELEREAAPEDAAPPPQPDEPVQVEVDAALMTGIERALFERRIAEEREAAAAAALAEAEDASAAQTQAAAAAAAAAEAPEGPVADERPGRRRRGLPIRRPRPSAVLVLLPLVGAGAAWGVGYLLESMPDPGSELGRLTALALVLAGPAATIGAIMARVWWPRLVGIVVAGGLAAAVFVGRSLIGG